MAEIDITKAQENRELINGKDIPTPTSLPFKLLNKQSNKTTNLLANSPSKVALDGRNRWFGYEFKEFVFVTYILVSAGDYSQNDRFQFEWIGADGKLHSQTARFKDKSTHVWINDVVKSIRFKPPSKWFAVPKINQVTIAGIPRADVKTFVSAINELEKLKNSTLQICDKAIQNAIEKNSEIEALDNNIASKNQEVAQIQLTMDRLFQENTELESTNEGLLSKKARSEEAANQSKDRLAKVEEEISVKTNERKKLSEEISEKSMQLKSLQDNINIFPNEIIGFADQGAKNVSLYWKLIAVPIGIILTMFSLLVFSAADLTTVVKAQQDIDIWSIFLTRLPYVAIATVIVTASYKICRVFISEMIKINQQKLGLTKISIIAKDVASAAEHGLDLTDEQLFQLRSRLKMQLMRDHMKEYLTKDFQVHLPKNIVGIAKDADGDRKLVTENSDGDLEIEETDSALMEAEHQTA